MFLDYRFVRGGEIFHMVIYRTSTAIDVASKLSTASPPTLQRAITDLTTDVVVLPGWTMIRYVFGGRSFSRGASVAPPFRDLALNSDLRNFFTGPPLMTATSS